jgi:hypothetical protein
VLANHERRSRLADASKQRWLQVEQLSLGIDKLVHFVEVLEQIELELLFEHVPTFVNRLPKPPLGVREDRCHPVGLLDRPDHAPLALDLLLRHRMQVDQGTRRNQQLMSVTQGVHDALALDSSQRGREERDVEAAGRSVHVLRTRNGERDRLLQTLGSRCTSLRNSVRVRVHGEHLPGGMRIAERHTSVPAAELEDAQAVERNQLRQRLRLGPFGIDPPGHGRIMTYPSSR